MGFRANAISKNAAEYLQPGEELERVAIVRANTGGTNYAIAASPSTVYVFVLGGMGFSKVKERLARVPIGKAVVQCRPGSIISVGRRGQTTADHFFSTLPGGSPKRLEAYVADHGGNVG